jgi:hypothetical protein
MADTSLDDGDMARLLARTADMLKQVRGGLTALHGLSVLAFVVLESSTPLLLLLQILADLVHLVMDCSADSRQHRLAGSGSDTSSTYITAV